MTLNTDEKLFFNDIQSMITRQYDEDISNKVMKKLRRNI